MAAANASTRGQRAAILASPLSEPSGFCLVVDCLAAGCGGERTFAMSDLAAAFYVARTGVEHPRQAAANRSGEWEKQYCGGLTLMRPAGRRNRQSCGCISSCASPSGDSR